METAPEEDLAGGPATSWPRWQTYGAVLASDFPFGSHLLPTRAATDLTFTEAAGPARFARPAGPPDYLSPVRGPEGESVLQLFSAASGHLLRFPGIGEFHVGDRAIRCRREPGAAAVLAEIRLLGTVLAFWLERHGFPALHAAGVGCGERAVAFLGANGGGKTSLALAFVAAGDPLLTDDILALEARPDCLAARPSYPQARLWPDEAAHFVSGWEALPPVHPDLPKRRLPVGSGAYGRFSEQSLPLGRIYLPQRTPESGPRPAVTIEPADRAEALMALIRHSFLARLVHAVGLQATRLEILARLVREVPVRRLRYPSGFEHLPRVREAILDDLAAGA